MHYKIEAMSTFKHHSAFPKEKSLQSYLFPHVCFNCRKSFKKPLSEEARLCPQCGDAMARLSRKFSAPASIDIPQWKKVQFLVDHGFLFQSVRDTTGRGGHISYPATLGEAKVFVVTFKSQAIHR
jgi:hypothetical protein